MLLLAAGVVFLLNAAAAADRPLRHLARTSMEGLYPLVLQPATHSNMVHVDITLVLAVLAGEDEHRAWTACRTAAAHCMPASVQQQHSCASVSICAATSSLVCSAKLTNCCAVRDL
jgi:hypothetical protein